MKGVKAQIWAGAETRIRGLPRLLLTRRGHWRTAALAG